MLLPGLKNLGIVSPIAGAVTDLAITASQDANGTAIAHIDRLEGMLSASFEIDFAYGSGGTTAILLVQTRLGGVNWLDIARADFAQADRRVVFNLSALTAKGITTYAALAAEGVNDGLLGPDLRAVLSTTGTYAGNTSIAVKATVR